MKSWAWADIMLFLWLKGNGKTIEEIEKGMQHYSKQHVRIAICDLQEAELVVIVDGSILISPKGKDVCKALEKLQISLGFSWGEL